MSNRLVVVGAGGHGLVVAESAAASGTWREIVFLDDSHASQSTVGGFAVLGATADLPRFCGKHDHFVVGIGDNRLREKLYDAGVERGCKGAVVIHPSSVISSSARLKPGTVVFANTVVAARTTVGKATIVNHSASIDHDCVIGSAVHISPGAHLAGGVVVGDRSWIGLGATVNPGIEVGADAVVGASAAVVDNVCAGDVVVGVPAHSRQSEVN